MPARQVSADVTASVSGPASTWKTVRPEIALCTAMTVMQTPPQAIDAPMAIVLAS